eukprot:1153270-Pelagomonas_calceolata.AAC.1
MSGCLALRTGSLLMVVSRQLAKGMSLASLAPGMAGEHDFRADSGGGSSIIEARKPIRLPGYLHLDLPRHVIQNVSRFRLRAHSLTVETVSWEDGISPVCDRCSCGQIQDEAHVLFMCRYEGLCALRQKYSEIFWTLSGNFSPAHPFLQHQPSVQALSNFLLQCNKQLIYFMSELLDLLLAGMDQPQADPCSNYWCVASLCHTTAAGTTFNWHLLLQLSCPRRQDMLVSNSETLRQVLKADLHLANMDESCWSAHVSKPFSGMRNEEVFKQKLLSASKISMQDFLGDLRYRQQKVWREADALSPREVNRKAVTYHYWCGIALNQRARTPFYIPSYLLKDLDKGVMRN